MSTKPKKSLKASTSTQDLAPGKKVPKKKVKSDKPVKDTGLAQANPLEDEDSASNPATPSAAAKVKKPKATKKSKAPEELDPEETVTRKKLSTRTKPNKASKDKTQARPRSASEADASDSRDSTRPHSSKKQSTGAAPAGGKTKKPLKGSGFFGDSDEGENEKDNGTDEDRDDEGHPDGGDDDANVDDDDPDDGSDDDSDLARNWKYVPMASPGDAARPVPADHDQQVLYTRLMTFCWAVATYDGQSGGRTLVHFQGTDPDAYYPALAPMISGPETVVTVTNGADTQDLQSWNTGEFKRAKLRVKTAMKAVDKDPTEIEYKRLFTTVTQDDAAGNEAGTLKIMPDGRCSRLTKQESKDLLAIEKRRVLRDIEERKRLDERARRRQEKRRKG